MTDHPSDPVPDAELGDLEDHAVPVDLLELHEALEAQAMGLLPPAGD